MPYLSDDLARELPAPASGQKVHWDSDADGRPESATPGFGLRVTAGNARAWILSYRTDDGTQRRFKSGRRNWRRRSHWGLTRRVNGRMTARRRASTT
jgi:hypothetical protein